MWRGCVISISKKKVICEVKHYNKQWCRELLHQEQSQVSEDKYYVTGKNLLEYELAKIRGFIKVYKISRMGVPVIRKRRQEGMGRSGTSKKCKKIPGETLDGTQKKDCLEQASAAPTLET